MVEYPDGFYVTYLDDKIYKGGATDTLGSGTVTCLAGHPYGDVPANASVSFSVVDVRGSRLGWVGVLGGV